MDLDNIPPRPSSPDEVKLGVDDAQVIAKTLPPAAVLGNRSGRMKEEVDHVMQNARGYVVERPVRSMLIAAAGGAVLTAGLLALARGDSGLRTVPPRVR